jgi:hypothetical protein
MSKGKPQGTCRTCGSEIVQFVNDGVFHSGQCEHCETICYRSQLDLLDALIDIRDLTESLDYDDGDALGQLDAQTEALDAIRERAYSAIKRGRLSFRSPSEHENGT